jgi:hypothetical protein
MAVALSVHRLAVAVSIGVERLATTHARDPALEEPAFAIDPSLKRPPALPRLDALEQLIRNHRPVPAGILLALVDDDARIKTGT